MNKGKAYMDELSTEVPLINSGPQLKLPRNGNTYYTELPTGNSRTTNIDSVIDEMGEEAPLIHSELQWKLPRNLGIPGKTSSNDNTKRTLGTLGGVSSPIALAMFSTFLFLRAGNICFNPSHWAY